MLEAIGAEVLKMQLVERLIGFLVRYVLHRTDINAEDVLERAHKQRSRTLGFFIRELKDRYDLTADFEFELDQLVEARNVLAHRLHEVPGWNLYTPEGRDAAMAFLNNAAKLSRLNIDIFETVMKQWMKRNGGSVAEHEATLLLRDLNRQYGPVLK